MPPASVSPAVEHLGAALAQSGLPRLPARAFAALLADEDGRLTAAELGGILSASPAAISGAMRYLLQVHFARREREPGSRRDVFVVQADSFHDVLLQKDQIYGPLVAALDELERSLAPDSGAGHRVALALEFLRFIQTEMDAVAQRWEQRKRELTQRTQA